MNTRDLLMALAGLALLLSTGCSLALSVTVARGDAATGEGATRAASDHWDAAVVRAVGDAAGTAVGAAAAEAAGLRALRPPTPVPAK